MHIACFCFYFINGRLKKWDEFADQANIVAVFRFKKTTKFEHCKCHCNEIHHTESSVRGLHAHCQCICGLAYLLHMLNSTDSHRRMGLSLSTAYSLAKCQIDESIVVFRFFFLICNSKIWVLNWIVREVFNRISITFFFAVFNESI